MSDPLPPILPGAEGTPPRLEAPPDLASSVAMGFQGRLHPLTLVMIGFQAIRSFLIPALFVLFTGSQASLGIMLLFFLALNIGSRLIRYFTFTYRVEGGDLITRQGIIERQERRIPLARVQDLRLEQGLIHRCLRVVDVHVETAGGEGAEASLSVLSRAEAERLRRAVFETVRSAPVGAEAVRAETPIEEVRTLSVTDLVWEGLTSNRAASALVVVLASWQFLVDLLPASWRAAINTTVARGVERWAREGAHVDWISVGILVLAVLVASALFSVAGSLVLFYGFNLSRRGEDLFRSYGLLTRRSASLPRRRIQLLKIEQPWLRRLAGLATLKADTAGSRAGKGEQDRGGRDVLLPVARMAELDRLLRVCFPDLEDRPVDWRSVSRCAVRRGTTKGAVVLGLVAVGGFAIQRQGWAFWPLAFVPAVYGLNVLGYRFMGYALGEHYFQARRGWLNRSTHVVPIRNMQALVVRQNPLDRRFGVGTLVVDTAGQANTGGGPHLRNIPLDSALSLARELAQRAAATRFRW